MIKYNLFPNYHDSLIHIDVMKYNASFHLVFLLLRSKTNQVQGIKRNY